jgi:acyl carrier protein
MNEVLVELSNEFGIDLDDEEQLPSYLSLKSYIKNTYGELIKQELGLV